MEAVSEHLAARASNPIEPIEIEPLRIEHTADPLKRIRMLGIDRSVMHSRKCA